MCSAVETWELPMDLVLIYTVPIKMVALWLNIQTGHSYLLTTGLSVSPPA